MKGKVFTAQEVQAMLNGSKVMFREVIKPYPVLSDDKSYWEFEGVRWAAGEIGEDKGCKETALKAMKIINRLKDGLKSIKNQIRLERRSNDQFGRPSPNALGRIEKILENILEEND